MVQAFLRLLDCDKHTILCQNFDIDLLFILFNIVFRGLYSIYNTHGCFLSGHIFSLSLGYLKIKFWNFALADCTHHRDHFEVSLESFGSRSVPLKKP